MLRLIAILFGIAFIFAGVAGNMPMFLHGDMLFGIQIDRMHNLVHIITGVVAIMAATRFSLTVWFFRIFGLVYTIVGIYGFWTDGDLILMHTNLYGNIFHFVVGIICLFLGFIQSKK